MRLHVFAAAILLAACSGSKNEQKPDENMPPGSTSTSAPSASQGAAGMTCPAQVPGTTVSTEDTPDGVAMIFTTSDNAEVPALRQSVSQMAHAISQSGMSQGADVRTSEPSTDAGTSEMEPRDGEESEMMHPENGSMQEGGMAMPQARTNVVSIDKGARLELTPTDPSNLQELREHAQRHAQMMQDGSCPMMKQGS